MTKFAISLAVLVTLSTATSSGFAQEEQEELEEVEAEGETSVEPAEIGESEVEAAADGSTKLISAALLLGFGTDLGEEFNPFGLGLGARGGYNLDRLYVGGVFVFHLGGSTEVTTDDFRPTEFDYSMWLLGAEAGYEFPVIERLIVRPSAILAISHFSLSSDNPLFGQSASEAKLLFSLGATALYDITPDIFAGGELRFPIALGSEGVIGFVIYATGGMRF